MLISNCYNLKFFQVKTRMTEEAVEKDKRSAEDEAKAIASMRLAYQDLSIQQKTQVRNLRLCRTIFEILV